MKGMEEEVVGCHHHHYHLNYLRRYRHYQKRKKMLD